MSKLSKIANKAADGMLIDAFTDNIMKKTRYKDEKLQPLYNTMISQKHRMLYYKKLKKKLFNKCIADRYWESLEKKVNKDRIWVCWLDGMKKAPDIVKSCYKSLENHIPAKNITVITRSNFSEFVELPEDIIKKWQAGIIGPAHFSDILRTEILIKYGGYWIDSTVYCTDSSILQYIDKQPLFMYSFYYFGFNPEIMEANNWFIYSTTNNNILCLMRELLYAYWRTYDRAVNYFFYHILLSMAIDYYREEYDKMPIVSQVDSHILATYIFDDFDKDKLQILCKSTGFHKLSTRFDLKKKNGNDTFYDMIITNRL